MEFPEKEPFTVRWTGINLLTIFIFSIFFTTLIQSSIFEFLNHLPDSLLHFISAGIQPLALLFFSWLIIIKVYQYNIRRKFQPLPDKYKLILQSFGFWLGATALNGLFLLMVQALWDVVPEPQHVMVYIVEYVRGYYILLYLLLLILLVPMAEEIFFRGLLYPYLRNFMGIRGGALVTSAIFALVHVHVWSFFPTFLAGLGFVYFMEKTKTLWAPIIAHAVWNCAIFLIVALEIFLI